MGAASRPEPAFYETMPRRYRQLFRGIPVQEHAAIVANRRASPAHAEIWRRLPQGGAIACIVAEDRPGLISYLGTAFIARSIDILSAQLFARANPEGGEVIDFFWLRRSQELGSALVDADLALVADLLGGLMTGDLRVDGRPLGNRPTPTESATLVGFDEAIGAEPATLSLETVERPGLFRDVTTAILDTSVCIVRSKRASAPGGRVIHRFVITERDGQTPDQYRRGLLQAEVLRVAEPAARTGHAAGSNETDPSENQEEPGGAPGARP
jgi:UTP:GlnB (protein PII) uridylyltransferase